MKSMGAALAAVLFLCVVAAAVAEGSRGTHKIESVIQLLQNLKEQVKTEGGEEEITYAKFAKWCEDSERTLKKAVTTGKETIDSLESEVAAKTQENKTLDEQIAHLAEELLKYDLAQGESDAKRANESALYTQVDADLASTIQAFESAITELEGAKTSTSASFAQGGVNVLAKLPAAAVGRLSDRQLALLTAFQGGAAGNGTNTTDVPDFLAKGDYSKHVKKYSFKSDNVIDLLKELKRTFEDQRVEASKGETNAVNAYNLAKNARDAAVQAAQTAKSEKETAQGTVQSELVAAEKSLTDAKADLEADETSLGDTKMDCDMKKTEWEERSSLRLREIEALDAGVEILAKVTGVRTEAPTNPVLPPRPVEANTSLLATPVLFLQDSDPKTRAVNLLRREATRLKSHSFQLFAEELASRVGGPFDEVNNMIQKMIFRLMAEQKDEDDHKNWCDLELSKTNASKTNKEDKITEFDAKLTLEKATVQELGLQIKDADEMVAQLTAFMEEATEVRRVGKEENAAAIKDAKDAQAAIAQAISVIEQYYKDSGMMKKEAWELVQRGSAPVTLPNKPSTWEASYTGVADPTNQPDGIITLMKKISSEFSQMEADTMAQEVTDQKNYDEEVTATEIEKARRVKESEMKTQQKQRTLEKITELEKSKKHTQEGLAAAEQYLKDLAPACLEGDSTYEDRKAARSDEIQALKEAQVILADAFTNSTSSTNSSAPPQSNFFLAPIRRRW